MTGRPPEIPPPGDHGGDGARIAAALGVPPDQVLDLSASLNPFAPDVPALARRHLDALGRYPDVDEAGAVAAGIVGVPVERLVLTAGGAQAIALVADRLGDGWVDEPDFGLYRRHLQRLRRDAPRWRSDPHSPSGGLADPDAPRPDAPRPDAPPVTVWDEAFLPLSAGVWTRHRPGWVIGSFTKAFACPGLRLGYAVAPTAEEADRLRARRPGWAVDGLGCALLPYLAEMADPEGWTEQIAKARGELAGVLQEHGFEPHPSAAPWLLVPEADGLRDILAREAVVVRDCTSFGLPDTVRVAVPDGSGLERLAHALDRMHR